MKNSLKPKSLQLSRYQKYFLLFSIIIGIASCSYAYFSRHTTIALGQAASYAVLLIGVVYNNPVSFPYLHHYVNFTIGQIPNILQNLTFAGFVAIGFKHQSGALLTIVAVTLIINNLYLNNRQAAFIRDLDTTLNKQQMSHKFLTFNYVLTALLFIVLYPLASDLLAG